MTYFHWRLERFHARQFLTFQPFQERPTCCRNIGEIAGHAGLVAGLRAELPPTLAVAGNYLDGVGVPGCLVAAGRAATAVAAGTS